MAKKQTMDHAQLLVLSLLAGEDMYGYQMIFRSMHPSVDATV